jgi:hypothetical protein
MNLQETKQLAKMMSELLKSDAWKSKIIIEKIKYKNWDIEAHCSSPICCDILIKYNTTCSRTGKPRYQRVHTVLPLLDWEHAYEYQDQTLEQKVLEYVMEFIIDCENHEARENFKYKGQMIFDPHEQPYNGQLTGVSLKDAFNNRSNIPSG